MRVAAWLVLGLSAACGRIGFDAIGDVGDGTSDAAQGSGGGGGGGGSGDVTAGLLAYYPFEDDLTNGADDASGN